MRGLKMRRFGLSGAVLAATFVVGTAPAQAATEAGVAGLGSAGFTKGGQPITVPSIAPCSVDGTATGTSGVIARTGITFGGGTTSCTRTVVDPEKDITTTKSEATGTDFDLSALRSVGGPRLRMRGYHVDCSGSQGGTSANWSFSGLSGVTGLPQPIPSGYVHQLKKSDGTVLAEVTFGETILPEPPDGGIAMNALHIRFSPGSGITGEVVLGATACSPTP